MNSGRADASTSTDDEKDRPLCLFYFTHPFGVLSPDPPSVTVAPPHVARTFVDMRPAPPYWSDSSSPGYDTSVTSTRPSCDPGDATVHRNPINVVRNYGLDRRRPSVSSSFFSSDIWLSSSESSRKQEEKRIVPYNRTLPPLRLPSHRDLALDLNSSEDIWTKERPIRPLKFSLPPIEMPVSSFTCADDLFGERVLVSESETIKRNRRVFGVKKHRRRMRLGSIRRMITCLMQRNLVGCGARGVSPALRDSLRLLRDAWPEPASLRDRCTQRAVNKEYCDPHELRCAPGDMFDASGAGGSAAASGGASPGLMRRRYSVPETIMRKYRLAQQQSEGESGDGGRWSAAGPGGRVVCAWCGSRASAARREREHMRKSALLRLWSRSGANAARACPCAACGPGPGPPPVGTRSLDASHSELRASPRRHRPESPRERRVDCSPFILKSCSDAVPERHSFWKSGSPVDSSIVRSPVTSPRLRIDNCSFSDLSDPFTSSPPTTKEIPFASSEPYTRLSTGEYIDGRVSEKTDGLENNESNVIPYTQPLTLETPSYDILEIVVSETLEVRPASVAKHSSPERSALRSLKDQPEGNKRESIIPIDEYVSNILVESLNTLNDQLESMNASIGCDRKLNIVEKEIKVKLQNTGVNTIVHLSPTSNNQIIFGNEELYESNERSDLCNDASDTCSSNIREETISVEMNNNLTSAESLQNQLAHNKQTKTEKFIKLPTETVNKAVLQQIQKLFKEEVQYLEPENNASEGRFPGVAHIEISNVDVFIDENGSKFSKDNKIKEQSNNHFEALGGVGTCNYYTEINDTPIVPRFSAFPHTESMEVNTSSSEDTEILGSECTSLVDSLDDPNSPRSILLRRSFNNKKCELVRSAVDVLDLLPENTCQSVISPKEKSESFFIRIKDNDCDCEKENIVVADHMPETIKQRLYRRQRKRELRMESARRSKVKQLKRDLDSNIIESKKLKKEVERESMILINSLIDDVVLKIAQDEYKCMHIKQKANKMTATKSDENLLKKHWTSYNENNNNNNNNRDNKRSIKTNVSHSYEDDVYDNHQKNDKYIRGRLSLHSQSSSSPENSPPTRVYQKSEISDGNKCIEILEILEYMNSSQNSETTNSDENHNLGIKNKKSRIPIPVNEKVQKIPKNQSQKFNKSNGDKRTPSLLSGEKNCNSSHLLANMLLTALVDTSEATQSPSQVQPLTRRASVPCEAKSRSNSLRFKNVFDIIPEEKSSLSFESTGEESSYRRASAPSFCEFDSPNQEDIRQQSIESKEQRRICREISYADTKSAGTSPIPESYKQVTQVNVGAMTSPHRKSAGTSPIRVASASSSAGSPQTARAVRALRPTAPHPSRSHLEEGSNSRRKSINTAYQPTHRLRGGHSESDGTSSILHLKQGKRDRNKERTNVREMFGVERGKSEAKADVPIERDRRRRNETREERDEELEEEWSSSESSGSLLCSLAPAWLTARRRRRRAEPSGEWAVTVAGSCPSALPNDVEMRLRFPERRRTSLSSSTLSGHSPISHPAAAHQIMPQPVCHRAVECRPPCSHGVERKEDTGRVTLTVKKEASDSSILASKSIRKSSELLPELHTYRASRSKIHSSVKARRGYSLHCWLPKDEPSQARPRDGLAVEGNAIVPRRKPRAPSMTERDLTRRHSHHHHQRLPHLRSFLPANLRNIF